MEQNISNRLDRIEEALEQIRENMVDKDTILSGEEKKILDESVENEKSGELVSLDDVKNVRAKV
jgi:hypothetical protein